MDLSRLAVTGVIGGVNVWLALAVYTRNKRSPANRWFAAAVLMIVGWLTLAFFSDQVLLRDQALVLNRLTMAAAVLMGVCLVGFTRVFPSSQPPLQQRYRALLGMGVIIAGITAFTPLVIVGARTEEWGTSIVGGTMMWLPTAWLVIGSAVLVGGLAQRNRRATDRDRTQLKYLSLGFVLFSVASLLFGLIFPLLTGSWEFSTLNAFPSVLFVGFTAYAMVKHRFMDIRFVVFRGVAYLMLLLVLGLAITAAALAAHAAMAARLGLSPDAIFVVSSLAAILVFQPLRRVLEHFSDGLLYRRTYDPQSLLSTLGNSLTSTLDLGELEEGFAPALREGMRLTSVAIVHVRAGEIEAVGAPDGFISKGELLDLLRDSDSPLIFADDPNTSPEVASLLGRLNVRVLLPLRSGETALGAILLGPKLSGGMFSTQDATFLETLGREATIAFRNALLFAERNQRVLELSSLNALAGVLGGEGQLEAILERALGEVMRVTDAEGGSIMLLQADGETLAIKSSRGLSREIVESARPKIGEGIAGWVAQNRKPLVLMDLDEDGFGQEMERQGIRSALCVPLVCKGRLIGVLNISRVQSAEAFTAENFKVVSAFAGQLAVAIENSKLEVDVDFMFDSLKQTRREFDDTQEFFAKASHELRTPLNSIIGFGSLLGRGMAGPLTDEQQRQVDMILASGKRLLALVNDLLDLEKLSTGKCTLEIAECDLDALVKDCADVVQPLAAEKGLELRIEYGGVTAVELDARRVEQAVLNLLSNAIKFTDDGFVRIRTAIRGDMVSVQVCDTGRGIAHDLLPHVFDEFVSGAGGTNGTGLGLSITRQVAERHGGRIAVSSRTGVGTTFKITLPRVAKTWEVMDMDPDETSADYAESTWGHLRAL